MSSAGFWGFARSCSRFIGVSCPISFSTTIALLFAVKFFRGIRAISPCLTVR